MGKLPLNAALSLFLQACKLRMGFTFLNWDVIDIYYFQVYNYIFLQVVETKQNKQKHKGKSVTETYVTYKT